MPLTTSSSRVSKGDNKGVFWTVAYGSLVVLVVTSAVMLWRLVPAAGAPTTAKNAEAAPPKPVRRSPSP